MPLLHLGGEVDREIDGDVYTLRQSVSWTAREKYKTQALYYVKRRDIDNGLSEIRPDDLIPMTFETDEEATLNRLETWLVRWSHKDAAGNPERITRKNLERLPVSHVRFLVAEIRKLEQEQDGPADDSPLAAVSNA